MKESMGQRERYTHTDTVFVMKSEMKRLKEGMKQNKIMLSHHQHTRWEEVPKKSLDTQLDSSFLFESECF